MNTTPTFDRPIRLSKGRAHGPVSRVFSPGDAGQVLKPFVFLDRFDLEGTGRPLFAMHPHSGIATMTVLTSGRMRYEDTTGKSGVLEAGSVEWMRAGAGVWHDGWPERGDRVQGWQLWFALADDWEHAAAASQYLDPGAVPQVGPARVVLGEVGGARSAVLSPPSIDVLHVRLRPGEDWRHAVRPGQQVAWLHVARGAVEVDGVVVEDQLAVLPRLSDDAAVSFRAMAAGCAEFILGLAPRHPFELVMGRYSVHTSPAALQRGEQEIARIGEQLRHRGPTA